MTILDEPIGFGIAEQTKKVEHPITFTEQKLIDRGLTWQVPKVDLVPSGDLRLVITNVRGVRQTWSDGGRRLEQTLNKFMVGLPSARIQLWEAIQAHELKRVAGGESIVEPYTLHPSEFFPCAVEAFFQKPIELSDAHRRLYRFLSRYFLQSPALWESKFRARSPD